MKKYLVWFLAIGLFFVSCKKDDVVVDNPDVNPEPTAVNVDVQDFMWKAMNAWYFWQADVPDLADTRFTTDADYTAFLESETEPGDFFNSLKFSEDRFSVFSDDFKEFTQASAGISRNNGLKFGLVQFQGSNSLFGYVRYVLPDSDAATKPIARGDIFTGVNGSSLSTDNYRELLFGDANTYTLDMATLANNTITPNGIEVELTKQENFQEDPILIDKVIERDGIKIGYLLYNVFFNEFDEQLNAVFGNFKDAGVTELVLDLRYNPGGDVVSANSLASMIYDTDTSKLLSKQRYSPKSQSFFESQWGSGNNFRDATRSGTPINTLNLSKVYVLALRSSASASELIINNLDPYMNVVHIGETTRGKNEFSITMVDDLDNFFFYNPNREDQIKEGNTYAIRPLIGRTENSDGFSDYTGGLMPDIELEESLDNLGVLGNENEPLLAMALADISNSTGKFDFTAKMPFEVFEDSEMMAPFKNVSIIELPKNANLEDYK